MRNFWYQSGSGHAVGAAPRGRPPVCGSDFGHAPANPHHVGRGLGPRRWRSLHILTLHSSLFTLYFSLFPCWGVIGGGAPSRIRN